MATPKVLVAGFGPFPGAAKNPSGRLALAVARSRRPASRGAKIIGAVIPTVYQEIFSKLADVLKAEKPDVVLMFGLAGSTPFMRVETRAMNVASSIYPDAAGVKPADHSLVAGSPQILNARAPVHRLLLAARRAGAEAKLSVNAGRYICNAAFFHVLDTARKTDTPKLVAFVHIPWPRGRRPRKPNTQKSQSSSLEILNRAGEEILLALIAAAQKDLLAAKHEPKDKSDSRKDAARDQQ
jgi:pyroglutamyl-peptidase